MLQMITDNDGPYADRPIFALRVAHTWEHDPTVTLLGDAAHLMPPLGVGVNLAMLDASDLAHTLTNAATVDKAILTYEETMLPRSIEMAQALEAAPSICWPPRHPTSATTPPGTEARNGSRPRTAPPADWRRPRSVTYREQAR